MADERTPLLWSADVSDNLHEQFCALTGVPPSNAKHSRPPVGPKTLYGRATKRYAQARRAHSFMTALSNTLLLSQVVLGATLTALGASESSHILITAFGVVNTVIAGLVAYLKSRGQPARQRIFRDELERVVDEIENSEIMWLGIAQGIHGYSEIDIDDKVTVRSEVARLMRCYEKAVRNFAMSNPDNYLMGQSEGGMALRPRAGLGGVIAPAPVTLPVVLPSVPAQDLAPPVPAHDDPDQSPASAPSKPPTPTPEDNSSRREGVMKDETKKDGSDNKNTAPNVKDAFPDSNSAAASAVSDEQHPSQLKPKIKVAFAAADPDESPATAAGGFERPNDEGSAHNKKDGKV